jgi:hypothetical protein
MTRDAVVVTSGRRLDGARLDPRRVDSGPGALLRFRDGRNGKYPDGPSKEAQALSGTLKRLGAYPLEQQPENYRSGAAVRRKLADFLAAQGAAPGLPNGSRMDTALLWEFFNSRDGLRADAHFLRVFTPGDLVGGDGQKHQDMLRKDLGFLSPACRLDRRMSLNALTCSCST